MWVDVIFFCKTTPTNLNWWCWYLGKLFPRDVTETVDHAMSRKGDLFVLVHCEHTQYKIYRSSPNNLNGIRQNNIQSPYLSV